MKPGIYSFLSALMTLILIGNTTNANLRRIGYWGTAVANVDYATADAAVTAAIAGDTIQVYPNSNYWSFNNLNKKLVIIGVGYYHYPGANGQSNYNANLQIAQPWSSCYINFFPGCDGSIITGCEINGSTTQGTAGINNVKITNCRLSYLYFSQGYTYDNWEVSKCDIYSTGIYENSNNAKVTNLKVFNCILQSYGFYSFNTISGQTGIVENCVFLYQPNFGGQAFLVQNCIFYNYSPINYSNCVFNNNLFLTTPSPAVTGANNQTGVSGASLFLGYPTQGTYSYDERFKLKPGSPAIGAGISGVDCGIFGGVNPYKLSGIPAIPAFYKLNAPTNAASANPYTITFSVRANN